ncbi:RAMP superfamily CRISPR-associated protein [Defluviitalea phaphyphila]|uniref:RAMP superfamily CRISPR-associated protein n=1 Tax=Defluviitalea phaphyphila TaxID=1473580 RepID=UPI000730E6FA|nr:RAMP superfamily CRISPR-associated protein [Defluviitalea phaphyphila]
MNIRMKFNSPLLIGGKKLTSNFIQGIDYIPGNVVRAAFARHILNHCAVNRENYVEINREKKYNWVYFRNLDECKKCIYKNICKKFSDIEFSFFYPEDTEVVPLTAMKCKENDEHGYIDCLVDERKCKKCEQRVEFSTGLRKNDKPYSVIWNYFTRTSINPYTQTSKDGSLYTLVAVEGTTKENDKINSYFKGKIEGINEEELKLFNDLRIGKYISSGFGQVELEIIYENKTEDQSLIINKMKKFDKKFKNLLKKERNFKNNNLDNFLDDNLNYFAILFVSDVKLPHIELNGYKKTEEYKKEWQNLLDISEDYAIQMIYGETNIYRGYDTSKGTNDNRKSAVLHLQKGSVIVLKTNNSFEQIYKDFSNKTFGLETENGFGWIKIYDGGVDNE